MINTEKAHNWRRECNKHVRIAMLIAMLLHVGYAVLVSCYYLKVGSTTVLFVLVFLTVLVYWVQHFRWMLRLKTEASQIIIGDEVAKRIVNIVDEIRVRNGMSKIVLYLVHPGISPHDTMINPLITDLSCTGRKVIVANLQFIDRLADDSLKAVLSHECGHFKGGDIYLNHLYLVLSKLCIGLFCICGLHYLFVHLQSKVLSAEKGICYCVITTLLLAFVQKVGKRFYAHSRRMMEFRADLFAAVDNQSIAPSIRLIETLRDYSSAAGKVGAPVTMISFYPPLSERITALRTLEAQQ